MDTRETHGCRLRWWVALLGWSASAAACSGGSGTPVEREVGVDLPRGEGGERSEIVFQPS